MEFFEFILVLSITVLLPLTILKSVMDYKKSKLEAERNVGEHAGLTVGELKKVLGDVVREANAPLIERIEALEREGLPASASRGLLADVEDEDVEGDAWAADERAADKSVGRRVHG